MSDEIPEFSATMGAGATVAPCPYAAAAGRVEVLILGEDDGPLAGVVVELRRGQAEAIRCKTDSSGTASFAGISGASLAFSCPRLDAAAWELRSELAIEPGPAATAGWQPLASAEDEGRLHTLLQGETVASLAALHGVTPTALWKHDKNAVLRAQREFPDVLAPDDQLWIPGIQTSTQEAQPNTRYTVRRIGVPAQIRLQFTNLDQSPRPATPYLMALTTRDGAPVANREGETDADGMIIAWVPPSTSSVDIEIGPPTDREWHTFEIGHLDPVTTVTGVQARLNNLGYQCGEEDGILGPRTRIALEAFQIDTQCTALGILDDATRTALRNSHGS